VYFGTIEAGDTLQLEYDDIGSLMTRSYPLGSLIEETDILQLLNDATNNRPYWYPVGLGYGRSINDLNTMWYGAFTNPRSLISGNDSERLWRLDEHGESMGPKYDVTSQYVWAQAIGVFQVQLYHLVLTQWAQNHWHEVRDEDGAVLFDLFDADRSLPVLLESFYLQLEFYRLYLKWNPAISYSANPCNTHANLRCEHDAWLTYVSHLLEEYNGDFRYPDWVFRWLSIAYNTDGVAFGGNVPYPPILP
jgi:hypothetical protein